MTFFGETLIEEQLVTPEQLTEALVMQSEELASPIRIALDQNLATPHLLLEALFQAAEQHISVPEAMFKSGAVDASKVELMTAALKKQRRPIGQILVEEGGVELRKVSALLSQFQKTHERLPDADGFEFHFPEVHGETKKQYLRFFSNELKSQIEKNIQALVHVAPHQLSEEGNVSRRLEDMAQQLSAAAGFARMEVSHHLAERAAQLLENLNTGRLQWTHDSAQQVTRDLILTLDVLWELQRFIEISGAEREFWQNAQSRQNFLKAFQALERHLS